MSEWDPGRACLVGGEICGSGAGGPTCLGSISGCSQSAPGVEGCWGLPTQEVHAVEGRPVVLASCVHRGRETLPH